MNDYSTKNIIPFDYLVQLTLSANQRLSTNLVMMSDSQFELHRIAGSCTADADTDFMPNGFELQINDLSTGRQFSNDLIPQRVICAPANGSYRLMRPVQFPPNANLQFDFRDVSGAGNTVKIVLQGFKIFGDIQ